MNYKLKTTLTDVKYCYVRGIVTANKSGSKIIMTINQFEFMYEQVSG